MRAEVVNRFSAVRLRRHGVRPLCFDGALLVRSGEDEGPQIRLYEIDDGALALAIELPGYYTDAWRLESIEEVAEFVAGFDPLRRIGFDITPTLDPGCDAEASAPFLEAQASMMGPAFRRVVDAFIRLSHSPQS